MRPALYALLLALVAPAQARDMTLQDVLGEIGQQYRPLQTSRLAIEQARLERQRVDSLLGWQLGARSSYSHDVSLFGTPSDTLSLGMNATRQLDNGSSLSTEGSYRYEDNELTISPLLPNPSHNGSIDLSYRQPLRANPGRTAYIEGQKNAATALALAEAQRDATYDRTADQAITLFYGLASVRAAIANLDESIRRSTQLLAYIDDNYKLGLAEEHDRLQVRAQIESLRAERQALVIQLQQQQHSLNRLMRQPADSDIVPLLRHRRLTAAAKKTLPDAALAHSPDLAVLRAQTELSESTILQREEARKDTLDGIVSVGGRSASGDNAGGHVSEQDMAVLLQVEYRRALDKRGLDAELLQASLDKQQLQDRIQTLSEDIRYRVLSLIDELQANEAALAAQRKRLAIERQKLRDGRSRHREGRLDTQQLLLLENDLSSARLRIEQQQIEQARRVARLELLSGNLWQAIAATAEGIAQ